MLATSRVLRGIRLQTVRLIRVILILIVAIASSAHILYNPSPVEAVGGRGIPFVHNEGRVMWNGSWWWHPGVGEMAAPAVVGGTEAQNSFIMPTAGTWKHMLANITTAVPVGCSRSLYIRVNGADKFGVTWAAGESGNKSNLVDTATVAAGDTIVLHSSSTGAWGAGQSTAFRHALLFAPTADVVPFIGDSHGEVQHKSLVYADNVTWSSLTDGVTRNAKNGGSEHFAQCVVPVNGTFKYVYTEQNYQMTEAGETAVLTFRKNGADTAISFTWNGTSEDKDDLVTEVSAVAGDMVNWQEYSSKRATRIAVSICFIPDDPNQWWISRPASQDSLTALGVTYGQPTLGDLISYDPWEAVEKASPFPGGVLIDSIAFGLTTAPGVGQSRTATLRVGGVDTAITVTVSGASKFGIGGGATVETADWDMLSLSNATSSAANAHGSIALVGSYMKVPTVVTIAAENITISSALISGNVTDLGIPSENCDIWGLEWGLATGVYTDNWEDTGSMGVGVVFSTTASGLIEGFTYFYRAFARNPTSGYGYGAEENFTVYSPCILYEVLNTGQDSDSDYISGDNISMQSILASDNHVVNYMYLMLYQIDSPSYLHVELYLENSTTWVPIGDALASVAVDVSGLTSDTDGEWFPIYFDTNPTIEVGLYYDLVLRQYDNTSTVVWRTTTTDGPGGFYASSTDNGSIWTYDAVTFRDGLYALYDCPIPDSPQGLHIINLTQTSVTLAWQEVGYDNVSTYRLVMNPDQFPTGPIDGTLVYDGELTSAKTTDLDAGTTYYFGLWGYDSGIYSDNAYFCAATTYAGDRAPDYGADIGDTTSATKLLASPVGGLINFVSQYAQLPEKTVSTLGYSAIFIFALVAVAVYNRSVLVTVICGAVGLYLGYELGVYAIVFLIIAVVMGITIGTIRGGQPTGG